MLGRALLPLTTAAGHKVKAPTSSELDLFDPAAVGDACRDVDAILRLATRIRPLAELDKPEAWRDNDRLRADASRILVDAALAHAVDVYVQPTVTFVYPQDQPATECTAISEVSPILRSALVAAQQTARFAAGGRRGIALRFGLLDGPATGHEQPVPSLGATLHVQDAAHALIAALAIPSGIYNVCRDGERVSNARFSMTAEWRPRHT